MRDLQIAEANCELPKAKQAQKFPKAGKPKESLKGVMRSYRQPLSRDDVPTALLHKKEPGECLG